MPAGSNRSFWLLSLIASFYLASPQKHAVSSSGCSPLHLHPSPSSQCADVPTGRRSFRRRNFFSSDNLRSLHRRRLQRGSYANRYSSSLSEKQGGGAFGSRVSRTALISSGEQQGTNRDSRGWKFFRSLGSPRIWVAPMVDGSELPFRLLCKRHGAEGAYSPMLHAKLFLNSKRYREEHFSTCAEDRPLFVQFCANDPEVFLQAASLVQDNCDAIDLNLGCPQRIAQKGNYGAFLMRNLSKIEKLVTTASKGLSVPVTVKIRIFEEIEKTLDYVRMLRDAGATMIAVHGRRIDQKNSREIRADWSVIKRIVEEFPDVPIIANGNIRNREDVEECLRFTGAAAVMSAQTLLDDPTALEGGGRPTITEDPEQSARSMIEYISLVEKHPTKMACIHMHMHACMRDWLAEFTDLREELNKVPRRAKNDMSVACSLYREVAEKVEQRILHVKRTENRTVAIRAPSFREIERAAAREAAIAQQREEETALRDLENLSEKTKDKHAT